MRSVKVILSLRMSSVERRMMKARSPFESAATGPRWKRSAKVPAGRAMRSQGSESAATTAETASGCGFTVMVSRGTAPANEPVADACRREANPEAIEGSPEATPVCRRIMRPHGIPYVL